VKKIIKYRNTAGIATIRLSILSKIPPCPGIKFPESFTELVLFINDSNKSPSVPNKETIIA
jgi:hypothetical protein